MMIQGHKKKFLSYLFSDSVATDIEREFKNALQV